MKLSATVERFPRSTLLHLLHPIKVVWYIRRSFLGVDRKFLMCPLRSLRSLSCFELQGMTSEVYPSSGSSDCLQELRVVTGLRRSGHISNATLTDLVLWATRKISVLKVWLFIVRVPKQLQKLIDHWVVSQRSLRSKCLMCCRLWHGLAYMEVASCLIVSYAKRLITSNYILYWPVMCHMSPYIGKELLLQHWLYISLPNTPGSYFILFPPNWGINHVLGAWWHLVIGFFASTLWERILDSPLAVWQWLLPHHLPPALQQPSFCSQAVHSAARPSGKASYCIFGPLRLAVAHGHDEFTMNYQ